MDGLLAMEQLHYADEIRTAADVPRPDVAVKPAELTLARQLIEQTATEEFRPEQYHDTVRERVLEAIQAKVEGQEITAEPQEAPPTKIIDLMEALKASLAKRGESPGERKPAQRAGAKKAAEDEAEKPAARKRKRA
jgi:DNA end-binding protein Ku